MILSTILPAGNTKKFRIRPNHREGLRIQYWLKDVGVDFVSIATPLGIGRDSVSRIVFGRRHSTRVEAEIARILGKADWNEVVLEARSAVTGKPVNELVEEFNRKLQARDDAWMSGLGATRAKAAAGNARPNPKAAPAGRRAV